MNMRDSEYVTALMLENGFSITDAVDNADVILFNSCSVRKHAEDRLFSNIAELKTLKKKRPRLVIGLMGCTAQNYKESLLRKAPLLDLVCGPGNESDLPGMVRDFLESRCPIVAVDKVNSSVKDGVQQSRARGLKAFVSIGEGCNNFCSYCIVPYVRGRERSRKINNIIGEIRQLAGLGYREVTLLGQNVNSYSPGKGEDFIALLNKVDGVDGIERVRFMTSHPKDASTGIFKRMAVSKKVCEHLHLPLQSGSDRILKLMNRGYDSKKYRRLAESYRKIVPNGSITTDIIVGFPTESKADFKKTMSVVKEISFDGSFTFKYSPRPPARAAGMQDDVPKEEKEERLKALTDLQCGISLDNNRASIGSVAEVLIDAHSEKYPGTLTGRTRTNKIARLRGNKVLIGKTVRIRIDDASPHTLKGRIIK